MKINQLWVSIAVAVCALAELCLGCYAHATEMVHLVIKAPYNTPADETLQVVGTGFRTATLRLQDHLAYLGEIEIEEGVNSITFTINRGSNQKQAVDQDGKVINLTLTRPDFNKTFVYSVINWKDLLPLGVIGNVQVWRDVYSPQLKNKRNISIYLPPNYEINDQKKYPVLYVHDGQNIFDPLTSTTKVDWRVDDILTSEITAGRLPPLIVVAIDCQPQERYEEYDYLRRGQAYGNFIIRTVKPMVEKRFRTLNRRENTFLMGSSMGAFISFELLWSHPDIFSKAVGLSMPASINNGSMKRFLKSNKHVDDTIYFYIDHGNYGDDEGYEAQDRDFMKNLFDIGFIPGHLTYDIDPYGNHREVDWARRVPAALRWLLVPGKAP